MKRIDEKVKDIVDVRSYASLIDFVSDPQKTLAGYHFTDITSELMSKWIARVMQIGRGKGGSYALAGFRGVGKSHFIAAFGALLAHPEFRSRVLSPPVASSLQHLARSSCVVASVRRGSQPTLLAELKEAIAPILGCQPASLSDSLNEILLRASESAGGAPLIVLIDTAFERSSRVSREDGQLLSAIAEIARTLGIFVGIALDDDIAGADGVNSAISGSFVIDYLDQEHLYKIVDSHIFPKQGAMTGVLHEIYEHYRAAVPGFRWSEERFRSLYPLHPAIMEVAPFVRLYMHDFALLSFASEAGSRILGRPANSLIAPDEVFDKVESGLRHIEALKGAFAAFDKVNDEVVVRMPVMKRLLAKLVLKGLFLLSLNDEGATAVEIGAWMLIYDENRPKEAVDDVEALLAAFANASPEGVVTQPDPGGNRRYSFRLDGKDDLKSALDSAAENIPPETVFEVLKRAMEERFSDCSFIESGGQPEVASTDCVLAWRGGLRKGRILWRPSGDSGHEKSPNSFPDWEIIIEFPGNENGKPQTDTGSGTIKWMTAGLRDDEYDSIRRYAVLKSDTTVGSLFPDLIPAAIQANTISVEKILQRVFLDDGVLSIDGFEYNFIEEVRPAQSLSQIFTIMLEAWFEGRFPLHPRFSRILRMKDVSALAADFFGGAGLNLDDVQRTAEIYGGPLGIVQSGGSGYSPAEPEVLRELPLAREIIAEARKGRDKVSPLEQIFSRLSEAPYGLVREAAYLLLASLVSARLLEFVTSNGDRINHRSLDLQLIWDDIVGVAVPAGSAHSIARLLFWASLMTGEPAAKSLDAPDDEKQTRLALKNWLDNWNRRCIPDRFEHLRDEWMNTRIWKLARTSTKTFKFVADSVSSAIENSLSIESCLQRIVDAFADSESEYQRLNAELSSVEDHIGGAELCSEIESWLSLCEVTGDMNIDGAALMLRETMDSAGAAASAVSNVDLRNAWEKFRAAYSVFFVERHDSLLAATNLPGKLADIQKTDLWWEFENLSEFEAFDPSYRLAAKSMVREIRMLDCRYQTSEILAKVPECGCSFTLGKARVIESLPGEIWKTVNQGLASYRETLRGRRAELLEAVSGGDRHGSEDEADAATGIADYLAENSEIRRLSASELQTIRRVFSRAAPRPPAGRRTLNTAKTGLSGVDHSKSFDPATELQELPV
jgi:hypothetical protein